MRRGRTAVAVLVAWFVVLVNAHPAMASSATWRLACDKYSGGSCSDRLRFSAEPGERNSVTIEPESDGVVIRDLAGIDAGIGCTQVDELAIRCPAGHQEFVLGTRFIMGDRADVLDARRLPGRSIIHGGTGDDSLLGPSAYASRFVPGPGNDRMVGGSRSDNFGSSKSPDGSDAMVGGAQSRALTEPWYSELGDRVRYARARAVRVDLTGGRDDGGRGERDAIVGVERVETGSGNDVLVGTAAAERFVSTGGHDILRGGGGADDLEAADLPEASASAEARDDDVLDGGDGPDLLDAAGGADRLIGGPGRDQLDGGGGRDRIRSADRSAASDWVMCGDGADTALADAGDFLMGDCERYQGGRGRGSGLLAAALDEDTRALLVQVACGSDTDCAGRVRIELHGREIAASSFLADPHDSREVRLFPPTSGEEWEELGALRVAVDGDSAPVALLPRYRITQSLVGVR